MCDDVIVPTTTNNGQQDFDVHVIMNETVPDDFRPWKFFESEIWKNSESEIQGRNGLEKNEFINSKIR